METKRAHVIHSFQRTFSKNKQKVSFAGLEL